MPDVFCRRWGPATFAAYLDLGQRYPVFVGCEESREAAVEWGRTVLADEDGTLENRCGGWLSGGVSTDRNSLTMGKSRPDNRIGRAGAVNTRSPDLTSEAGRLPQ